jgi:hypothetical protein
MRKNRTIDIEDAVGNKVRWRYKWPLNKKEKWPVQKLLARKQQQPVRKMAEV